MNGTNGNPRVFHCGLWVEKKNGNGPGHYFHVQFHGSQPVNRPDYPEGWEYRSTVMRDRPANWKYCRSLIGRILLGKLASGVTAQQIHQMCQEVALPNREEACWDWTRRAVEAIQAQCWLYAFSWDGANGFRGAAYTQAVAWYENNPNRKEVHDLDMFGSGRDSQCGIL